MKIHYLKFWLLLCLPVLLNAQSNLTDGEYYWNTDPGHGQASSFSITTPDVNINETINVTVPNELLPGINYLVTRLKNADGTWSQDSRYPFVNTNTVTLNQAEYFWGADPGRGQGTPLSITAGESINETYSIPVPSALSGIQVLGLRVRAADGQWSAAKTRLFNISQGVEISRAEYFWDTDPGYGQANNLPIATVASMINETYSIPTTGLSAGTHSLVVRLRDENGSWSIMSEQLVVIQQAIYVDHTATGNNDGSSWVNAYTDLQDALAVAANIPGKIHVAQGTYLPDGGNGDRAISFDLPSDCVVLAGYPSGGDIEENRNPESYPVILSGDIGLPNNDSDNSYHVITTTGVTGLVVDGLTISNGNANGTGDDQNAGGWYNDGKTSESSPSIINCIFVNNKATKWGGAMFNDAQASSALINVSYENCRFEENTAVEHGGALMNFSANGGMYTADYLNCLFANNHQSGSGHGGAVLEDGFSSTATANYTNCVFYDNQGDKGGAISYFIASGEVINCSFANNIGADGEHIKVSSNSSISIVDIINSIFTDDIADGDVVTSTGSSIINASYSLFQGPLPVVATDFGSNLINTDPLYFDPATGDLQLDETSPAIDAGNNAANNSSKDINGNPRLMNTTIDMGAYESQSGECVINLMATGGCGNGNTILPSDSIHVLFTALNGTGPYTITLNNIVYPANVSGDTIVSLVEGVDFSGTPPYTFTLTLNQVVDDAGVCDPNTMTETFNFDIIPAVVLTGSDEDGTACEAQTLSYSVSPTGMTQYEFFDDANDNDIIDAGESLQLGASNLFNLVATGIGTSYNIKCKTDGTQCQSISNGLVSTVVGLPMANISITDNSGLQANDGVVCFGDVINLTASGGSTYNWSTGENTPSIDVYLQASDNVSVTVTDANGCADTEQVSLIMHDPISVNLNSITHVNCFGESNGELNLNATGGAMPYSYDIGGGSQATGVFSSLAAGTYMLTVTDANTCVHTENYMINEPVELSATISVNNISCFGQVDGSISIIAVGGVAPYMYDIGAGAQASNMFSGLNSGIYPITVTDANNCTFSASAEIMQPSELSLSVASTTQPLCTFDTDGSIVLLATGGTAPYSYQLNAGTAQSSETFSMLSAGTYNILVTDASGCTASISNYQLEALNSVGELDFSTNIDFEADIVSPLSGGQSDVYRFEVQYFNEGNILPPASYPRLNLDFESNGVFTDPNDKLYIMSEVDSYDQDVTDGKLYFVNVLGLEVANWGAQVVVVEQSGCEAIFPQLQGPEVLAAANVFVYAEDISFSNNNPDPSEYFNVFATIHNQSSFDANNFEVTLYNQFSDSYEYSQTIPVLAAGESLDLYWNVQAPAEDAWVPYRVIIDEPDVLNESNELDNTAVKPVTVGDFTLPISIVLDQGPTVMSYSAPRYADRNLTGHVYYDGLPPGEDNTVQGANVTFTIASTGEVFTGYTNNQGYFDIPFSSSATPGLKEYTGSVSDQTLSVGFNGLFNVSNPAGGTGCSLPDLVLSVSVDNNVVAEGETLSGIFLVENAGCAATTQNVQLTADFPNAVTPVGPFIVGPLAVGESQQFAWSTTYSSPQSIAFSAVVDSEYEIEELLESNNYVGTSVTVASSPNIVKSNCQDISISPNTLLLGTMASISFKAHNNSLVGFTSDFEVELNVEGDIYTTTISGGIPAEGSVNGSIDFTVPPHGNLNYQLIFDSAGDINETNELDNTYSGLFCLDMVAQPVCLAPGQKQIWQEIHTVGSVIPVQIGVGNLGVYPASNVDVSFEIMGPGFPNWTLMETASISIEAESCSCPDIVNFDGPFALTTPGVYDIRFVVDPYSAHTECDETNNIFEAELYIANQPDLRTLSTYIDPTELNPDVGEPISFNVSYDNVGDENIGETFNLEISVDGIVVETIPVTGLPSNAVATVSTTNTWSSSTLGGHLVSAFVDSGDWYAEADETNNEATRTIIVGTAPNLKMLSVTSSNENPKLGEEVLLGSVITNTGDIAASADLNLYYIDASGAEMLHSTTPITVNSADTVFFSMPYSMTSDSVYLISRIMPATPTEYNDQDNELVIQLKTSAYCNLVVTNTNDSGFGSLRQCIDCANSLASEDKAFTISFDIPGPGPHIIQPLSEFEQVIPDSLVIDGSTQPGNMPMDGQVVLDMTYMPENNKSGFRILGKNVGIYGLEFRNNDLTGNASALYFFLFTHEFEIGDSARGNWFTEDKWSAVIFLKENIYDGVIQSNVFKSDSLRISDAIIVNSGNDSIRIGGDSLWQRNYFYNCQDAAIEMRNVANNTLIENNYFYKNNVAIRNKGNFLGGYNRGNKFIGNEYECNTVNIDNQVDSNDDIAPPVVEHAKVNYVGGTCSPNTIVELYMHPDTCAAIVDCSGGVPMGRDTVGADGLFNFPLMSNELIPQGYVVSAIQTDTLLSGSSTFSNCVAVDSTCLDFVYSCEDDIIGSLRSAIDCAVDGETIHFLSYLVGDTLALSEELVIDKNIIIQGLGNPGIAIAANSSTNVIQVANGKTVEIKELVLCVDASVSNHVIDNNGNLILDNITLIDKRNGSTVPAIFNNTGAMLNVRNELKVLEE